MSTFKDYKEILAKISKDTPDSPIIPIRTIEKVEQEIEKELTKKTVLFKGKQRNINQSVTLIFGSLPSDTFQPKQYLVNYAIKESRLESMKKAGAVNKFSMVYKDTDNDPELPPNEMIQAEIELIPSKFIVALRNLKLQKKPEYTVEGENASLLFPYGKKVLLGKKGSAPARLMKFFCGAGSVTVSLNEAYEACRSIKRNTSSNLTHKMMQSKIKYTISQIQRILKKKGFGGLLRFEFSKTNNRPLLYMRVKNKVLV